MGRRTQIYFQLRGESEVIGRFELELDKRSNSKYEGDGIS